MADKKISQLTSATTPLAGTEVLPIVQSSTTKKVSVAEMQSAPVTAGTANGVQYLDATKSPTTGSTLVFVNDNLGVNTDTPRLNTSGVTAGNKTITIYSATSGGGGIEFATGSTTTSAATGRACFIAAGNTDGSRTIAAIDSLIQGSTAGNQGGNMRLFTKPDGGSAAVRLTLAAAGDVTVNSGNLVIGTAGQGIDLKTGSTQFAIRPRPGANDYLAIDAGGTERFLFNSIGQAYNSTGTWGTISDARLKENIVDATPKLNDLMQLRVVNFNLKAEPELKQIGFIAQEVEQVFPGLVDESHPTDEGDYFKSIKLTVLIPMLVKAIQEQQSQIESLKSEIETMKGA